MTQQHINRQHVLDSLEAQRHSAEMAGRSTFDTMRASDRAAELIARMEVAKMHRDRTGWETARAELMTLVNEL